MKLIFFLILFFSCTNESDPVRYASKKSVNSDIQLIETPDIITVDKNVKVLTSQFLTEQETRQRNDSILSSKVLILIPDNAVQKKDIDNLKVSNASKTITIAGLLKDQFIKTTAITNLGNANTALTIKVNVLVKDQPIKTAAIINLKKADSISNIKINGLVKENAAQAQLIKFLQDHYTSQQKQISRVQIKNDSLQNLIKRYAQKVDTVYSFKFTRGVVGLNWSQVIKVIQAEIAETAKQ